MYSVTPGGPPALNTGIAAVYSASSVAAATFVGFYIYGEGSVQDKLVGTFCNSSV